MSRMLSTEVTTITVQSGFALCMFYPLRDGFFCSFDIQDLYQYRHSGHNPLHVAISAMYVPINSTSAFPIQRLTQMTSGQAMLDLCSTGIALS